MKFPLQGALPRSLSSNLFQAFAGSPCLPEPAHMEANAPIFAFHHWALLHPLWFCRPDAEHSCRFLSRERGNIDLIFGFFARHSSAVASWWRVSQSSAGTWDEQCACSLWWMHLFITFPSVMPRPWLFEAGVLRFLSPCTVPPCVGRVEESVIPGEWDPFAQEGIKYASQMAISRLKGGWRRFAEVCNSCESFDGESLQGRASNSATFSLLSACGPIWGTLWPSGGLHQGGVAGGSSGTCLLWGAQLETGGWQQQCGQLIASREFLKELPAKSSSRPRGSSLGPGSFNYGICCLS